MVAPDNRLLPADVTFMHPCNVSWRGDIWQHQSATVQIVVVLAMHSQLISNFQRGMTLVEWWCGRLVFDPTCQQRGDGREFPYSLSLRNSSAGQSQASSFSLF